MRPIFVLLILLSASLLRPQSSTNFILDESTLNNGGNPSPVLSSTSYKMTLDAIGDGLSARGLAGASYVMDGGFGGAYPPPGEVQNLRWTSKTQFNWDPEPSAGRYNTYRGDLGAFAGYGACFHYGLTASSDSDTQVPGAGAGYFYLVTAENRLNEEGVKGYDSGGTPTPNSSPCP
jgi:hypothetical protein